MVARLAAIPASGGVSRPGVKVAFLLTMFSAGLMAAGAKDIPIGVRLLRGVVAALAAMSMLCLAKICCKG
ncbi:hypothetical protein B0T49_21415 [Chromobacterium violaceum]|nr:hypothetical protein B0T49_21415 [Chromobacterium violaceum]OQS47817.1 hypothetical protein B0T48_12095 [Chromobacterium violaceum]